MFENPFICSCNEKLDLNLMEPMVIDCGHTICKKCVNEIS
jgi:hypothetical protein